MAKMIKFEVIDIPKVHAVGKELRYSMDALMEGDNRLPAFWDKCFTENIFTSLEEQKEYIFNPGYIGVMTNWDKGDGDFSYICGMLMKEGTKIPEGYVSHEIEAGKVAVAWIKGKDTVDVCSNAHEMTENRLKEEGINYDGMRWCMELYSYPRFTTPDENGEIILDYYIPIK